MSTATIEAPGVTPSTVMFTSGDMGVKPKMRFEKKKDEDENEFTVLVLEDVAVFRSGSFEDSMGQRNTWEQMHMDSMASNFDMLRERNIFTDVPVRSGHPGWLVSGTEGTGKVVGWHTGIRAEVRKSTHDDNEYVYLLASYEIIDEEAQKAVSSGLWRNRSSEIGTYITNDGAEYFPVYMGFAYVDIPAVEGLNGFSKATHIIKEDSMTAHEQASTPAAPTPPTPPALPKTEEVASHAAPKANAEHAAPATPFVFKIGGNEVSDFAAVQSHIDTLEAFRSDTIEQGRLDFVNGLVESGKVLASQKENLEKFSKDLSDEQFGAWKAMYEDAPVTPVLAQTPDADPTFAAQSGQVDAKADEIAWRTETIRQHKRAGRMTDEQIKNTESYKRLLVLDPNFKL